MASQGDPRVLLVMNVVLSSLFAVVAIWGFSYLGLVAFTATNVATFAIVLMAVTYLVTK